jgi:predicted Zn-dependent protease
MCRHTFILILALSSFTASFCALGQTLQLPDIGDPAGQYLSSNQEHRLGAAVVQRIRAQDLVIDDVQLSEYLASVGQSIAAYAQNQGSPFTFFWVNDASINAFAAPGGFIGINAGLILATQSEAELAGVIAHEVAHVTQRHIARGFADQQQLGIPFAAAMLASALLAATSDSQVGSAAMAGTMAASVQHRINFTRANEQEADRVGTQFLLQSGFDPNGMANFFARLERKAMGSAARVPEFLLTHPLPRNRVADTLNRYGNANQRRVRQDTLAYYLAKARLRVLTDTDHRTLIRQFKIALSKNDFENETAERYGYTLALKSAGLYDQAQQQIAALRKTHPNELAFRIEEAEIVLAKGDEAKAWRLFEIATNLYPDDFTLAMHYGQALTTQGDPRQAMRLLQPHLQRRSQNVNLYALYAQAAQRAGDITTTHAALAEYYYLSGELTQAIEQAELGLKKSGASTYQKAQLHARLRQFQKEEKVASR